MKFFVISDTHSFYDEMMTALNEAGFDPNNENHWLIGCGDYFDRGEQSVEVLKYLLSLPRKTLVKGNHDDMLTELVDRGYSKMHDYRNGTTNTVCQLADDVLGSRQDVINVAGARFQALYSQMVDYFETANYIFVHSWIPLIRQDKLPKHYARDRKWAFNDDWRNATASEWEEARWGNPFELAQQGLKPDKTIVFGHWHTSWPRAKYDSSNEFGPDADCSIYYGDNIIGIDACTAYSGKVNVLVLEDEFMS